MAGHGTAAVNPGLVGCAGNYVLAGRDPLGRPAAKIGLSTVCTGSLADSPLGRCIAGELERALATASLPAQFLNWTKVRRYDFDASSNRVTIRAR